MSGPELAKRYCVGNTRAICLIQEKFCREQSQTLGWSRRSRSRQLVPKTGSAALCPCLLVVVPVRLRLAEAKSGGLRFAETGEERARTTCFVVGVLSDRAATRRLLTTMVDSGSPVLPRGQGAGPWIVRETGCRWGGLVRAGDLGYRRKTYTCAWSSSCW